MPLHRRGLRDELGAAQAPRPWGCSTASPRHLTWREEGCR